MLRKHYTQNNDHIRFGIVGCGAITKIAYLPFFKTSTMAKLTCLVDKDESVISAYNEHSNLRYVGTNVDDMFEYVDAVIVATPNYQHFPIAKTCLENGKHVLCEKPLAITSQECKQLISIAKKNQTKLTVAHVRRFYQAAKKTKNLIYSEHFGPIKSFEFEEGTIFNWPANSGFYFDKKLAGGGVLIDIGVHVLDLLLWWFGTRLRKVDYIDDNLGGVEAVAEINIQLSNNIEGSIKLSRLSILKNRYNISFENGWIEWNPLFPKYFYIYDYRKKTKKTIKMSNDLPVIDMVEDFIFSIKHDRKPLVSGKDGLQVIELIEKCYQVRKPLPLEWLKKN